MQLDSFNAHTTLKNLLQTLPREITFAQSVFNNQLPFKSYNRGLPPLLLFNTMHNGVQTAGTANTKFSQNWSKKVYKKKRFQQC